MTDSVNGMPHCRNCGWNCKPGCPYAGTPDPYDGPTVDQGLPEYLERFPGSFEYDEMRMEIHELRADIVKLTEQQTTWQTHALEIVAEIRPYLDQAMPIIEKVGRMLAPFSRMQESVNNNTDGRVARRGRRQTD